METDLDQLFAALRADADALKLDPPQSARRRAGRRRRGQITGALIAVLVLLGGTAYTYAGNRSPVPVWPGAGVARPTSTHPASSGVALNGVAFSPDGKSLATADADGSARLWSATTHQPIKIFTGTAEQAISVAFSPDGNVLAVADSSGAVTLWNVAAGKAAATLAVPRSGPVTDVAFSPDGKTVATASEDGPVRLWSVATGQVTATITATNVRIIRLAFSHDGNLLATGGQLVDQAGGQTTVGVWTVATGRPATTITGFTRAVVAVAFSPDGSSFAAGDADDGTVHVWSTSTGESGTGFVASGTNSVFGVAYSPDGKDLAVAYQDHTARLWSAVTGKAVTTFTGHTDIVEGLAFSPDSSTLATAGADGTLRLWTVPNS
jgi:WD40 repeat protein